MTSAGVGSRRKRQVERAAHEWRASPIDVSGSNRLLLGGSDRLRRGSMTIDQPTPGCSEGRPRSVVVFRGVGPACT